jgi:hypothetical protein
MKIVYRFTVYLAIIAMISVGAMAAKVEISPDGLDTVIIHESDMSESEYLVTDVVPFDLTPDWSCNLRMQVGGLAAGDLDGDDDMDLAVGCYHSQSYPPYPDWRNFILYNIGGQLQSTPSWWSMDSASTTEVKIADFNNDQRPDIFSGNGDFSLTADAIYFGLTNDSISRQPGWTASNQTWTTGVAICDFDHDGDIDVATSNQGISPNPYRPVSIFRNNNGALERNPSWISQASEISSAIAWGDVNHDGWEDLAVSKWVNFYSCVYMNNQGYIPTSPDWTGNTTQGQKGICWGDINGDTFPELAIGGSIPTQLYPNSNGILGTDPIWQSQNAYHGTQDMAWGDVDEDGDPDLATVEFSTGHLRIYLNRNGQLDQTPSWQYDSPNVGTALAFADINNDSHLDLIMGVSGQPCVSVFYSNLTSISDIPVIPDQSFLAQNYPNPFNASTMIEFSIGTKSLIRIDIYNILGRKVAILFEGIKDAGLHQVVWDGANMPSGAYFYRLDTDGIAQTRKMLLIK